MDYTAPVVDKVIVEPKVEPKVEPETPKEVSWLDSVPEDYRPHLKDVKDIGSLAKQYVDQQAFLGNSIRVPGDDAGPEDKQKFMEKLLKHAPGLMYRPDTSDPEKMKEFWATAGVPKDAKGYDLGELPEGVNPDFIENAKQLGHKYGLTNEGLKAYVKDQVELQSAQMEAANKAQEDDFKALNKEWGHATESKLADIKKFSKEMGLPEDFLKALENNQVGSMWLKPLDQIIKQFGGISEGQEASFQRGQTQIDTPAEIMMKIAEIEGNPAFRKTGDPQHRPLVEKRMELLKKLQG